jgi:uncharacterized protein YjbI with pentapeptide repeats
MSRSLKELIASGEVDEFNRRLREWEENHDEEYPSLQAETFDDLEISGFDFSDLDLAYAEFADSTLTDARFDRSGLSGTYIHGTTFIECYFDEANAAGMALDSCTFSKCQFNGVDFDDIEWTDCQFTECDFRDIDAEGPTVERTTFTDGAWDEVVWRDGELTLVTLRTLTLDEVDLTSCRAKNCYVTAGTTAGADLPDGFIEKTGRRRRME